MQHVTMTASARQMTLLLALLLLLGLQSALTVAAPPAAGERAPHLQPTVTPGSGATATAGAACQFDGYVFDDLNRNGTREPGEPGLITTVSLFLVGDPNPLITVTTDAQGYFCINMPGLAVGTYRLVQTKVPGYEVSGGQERIVTLNPTGTVTVYFPNVPLTPTPTATIPGGASPTPTVRGSPTNEPTPSATATFPPTATLPPTATPSATTSVTPTASTTASPTLTLTATMTTTATATPTTTPTITATRTLRALTPIATFITTTPGVLVTTTPYPGGPIYRLPTTGGGNSLMIAALAFGGLMLGVGILRRFFIRH